MNYILLSIYYLSHLSRASSTDRIHCTSTLACLPLVLTSQQFNLFSTDSVSHFEENSDSPPVFKLWCLISPCQTVEWFLRFWFEACPLGLYFSPFNINNAVFSFHQKKPLISRYIYFFSQHNLIPLASLLNPNPLILLLVIGIFKLSFSPGSFFFLQMFSDTLTNYLKHLGSFSGLTSDRIFTPLFFRWY